MFRNQPIGLVCPARPNRKPACVRLGRQDVFNLQTDESLARLIVAALFYAHFRTTVGDRQPPHSEQAELNVSLKPLPIRQQDSNHKKQCHPPPAFFRLRRFSFFPPSKFIVKIHFWIIFFVENFEKFATCGGIFRTHEHVCGSLARWREARYNNTYFITEFLPKIF